MWRVGINHEARLMTERGIKRRGLSNGQRLMFFLNTAIVYCTVCVVREVTPWPRFKGGDLKNLSTRFADFFSETHFRSHDCAGWWAENFRVLLVPSVEWRIDFSPGLHSKRVVFRAISHEQGDLHQGQAVDSWLIHTPRFVPRRTESQELPIPATFSSSSFY